MNLSRLTGLVMSLIILPLLVACNEESRNRSTPGRSDSYEVKEFTVYKQPTCDCCTIHRTDDGLGALLQCDHNRRVGPETESARQ